MGLNPDNCHFMVLGDPNCTCIFTCNGTTIETSQEEKVLAIAIDDKLTFTSQLGNTTKKADKKLHELSRVKCSVNFEQNKLIISSFLKSQFSYCPLILILRTYAIFVYLALKIGQCVLE